MQTLQEQRNSLPNDAEAALEKEFTPPAKKPVYDFCKRIFDIVMSAFALIVLSPVFLVVAIAIRREAGGKAI